MQPDDHMINAGQETNARGKDVALLAKGVVSYIAKGEFALADGHEPTAPLKIPADFTGICVASMADVAADERMIDYLDQLGSR